MKERLQKILSSYGIASRRAAEELIRIKKVTVNGETASIGCVADPEADLIAVDGVPLRKKPEQICIMLNKPRGFITSLSDEKGRRTVLSLLTGLNERVYPVGRLDYLSEGLLLLTNDGELAYGLTHPKHNVKKAYEVHVSGDLPAALPCLRSDMLIDGYRIKPAEVDVLLSGNYGGVITIRISEGRNRQIRKMCDNCGLAVYKLRRISVGGLTIGDLPSGKW
ncbi:MAG: pseudouridine synthase, partial [Bacillota bacterium]|nr:pseudouridine synthase [Bacillota bacterium]